MRKTEQNKYSEINLFWLKNYKQIRADFWLDLWNQPFRVSLGSDAKRVFYNVLELQKSKRKSTKSQQKSEKQK